MEDEKVLENLRSRVFNEFKPKGVIEEALVDRIIVCIWRLRRCAIADRAVTEKEYLEAVSAKYIPNEIEREFNKKIWVLTRGHTEMILRYETTIERQLYRVMRELREVQGMRIAYEHKALPEPE
jgi:hypothetical protein